MTNVIFDPKNKETKFYVGDCRDWAIQDGKCFGINPGMDIGYVSSKHPTDVTFYEGTEVTREEFAKMYPQVGL